MSDRFVRWQRYTMNQLTFSLNLFFGLSVAALAYALSIVRDEELLLCGFSKYSLLTSILSLCLAIFISCTLVINRLLDFRFTANKIRTDEHYQADESVVYAYRSRILGRFTWRLFGAQVLMMGVGLISLVAGVLSIYWDKIW